MKSNGRLVRPFFMGGHMNWADLWAALALVLVLEGLIPFVSPRGYKNMVQQMAAMPAQSLRGIGLALMIVGLLLLYFIRGQG